MAKHGISHYLVVGSDAHQNEYVPLCWQRRVWLSNFTGSAGDVLVGLEDAVLMTDGRYSIQAKNQLDLAHFDYLISQKGVLDSIQTWLDKAQSPVVLGLDPMLISQNFYLALQKIAKDKNITLKLIDENLVDSIWADRPKEPQQPVLTIEDKYTGLSVAQKLTMLREKMSKDQIEHYFISALDSIAWLLNIRGTDVEYNPLTISYLLVQAEDVVWYIDEAKVSKTQQKALSEYGIRIAPYNAFLRQDQALTGSMALDPKSTSCGVFAHFKKQGATIMAKGCHIVDFKACKNATELTWMRKQHLEDGAIMVRFLYWLEHQSSASERSECQVQAYLDQLRLSHKDNRGLSFPSISGFGPNGAVVHYRASAKTNLAITEDNLYLIDSGGQYLGACTDITRVVHLGEPTCEHKKFYTLVLKGHLALRHSIFPHGISGAHLDVLARTPLWNHACDYAHGTGHGVGAHLCVHEGPQAISLHNHAPLKAGMVVSNEPGYYQENHFGIRIENLVEVVEKHKTESAACFLGFEDLTYVPYAKKLIDTSLLNAQEQAWIDDYHQQVYTRIAPLIEDPAILAYLKAQTSALSASSNAIKKTCT